VSQFPFPIAKSRLVSWHRRSCEELLCDLLSKKLPLLQHFTRTNSEKSWIECIQDSYSFVNSMLCCLRLNKYRAASALLARQHHLHACWRCCHVATRLGELLAVQSCSHAPGLSRFAKFEVDLESRLRCDEFGQSEWLLRRSRCRLHHYLGFPGGWGPTDGSNEDVCNHHGVNIGDQTSW
jgi:hypothetical protein